MPEEAANSSGGNAARDGAWRPALMAVAQGPASPTARYAANCSEGPATGVAAILGSETTPKFRISVCGGNSW
jgi:hypothetical protein